MRGGGSRGWLCRIGSNASHLLAIVRWLFAVSQRLDRTRLPSRARSAASQATFPRVRGRLSRSPRLPSRPAVCKHRWRRVLFPTRLPSSLTSAHRLFSSGAGGEPESSAFDAAARLSRRILRRCLYLRRASQSRQPTRGLGSRRTLGGRRCVRRRGGTRPCRICDRCIGSLPEPDVVFIDGGVCAGQERERSSEQVISAAASSRTTCCRKTTGCQMTTTSRRYRGPRPSAGFLLAFRNCGPGRIQNAPKRCSAWGGAPLGGPLPGGAAACGALDRSGWCHRGGGVMRLASSIRFLRFRRVMICSILADLA